jgi:hypothetical protein
VHSHHILSRGVFSAWFITVDTDLGHQSRLYPSGFSTVKLLLPSPFPTVLFGRKVPWRATVLGMTNAIPASLANYFKAVLTGQ